MLLKFKAPVFVDNYSYEVTLEFTETKHDKANARLFDIYIENELVIEDFDVFSAANGNNIPTRQTFNILVKGNYLDIDFVAKIDHAQVSAVKIKSYSPDIKGCS
ncbi:MAG: malectin domain-containing carbohydrate-binding protein [Cyanobacteria bacterium P01_G01_bin.39]